MGQGVLVFHLHLLASFLHPQTDGILVKYVCRINPSLARTEEMASFSCYHGGRSTTKVSCDKRGLRELGFCHLRLPAGAKWGDLT